MPMSGKPDIGGRRPSRLGAFRAERLRVTDRICAGLFDRIQLLQLDGAVDLVREPDLADGEHHLRLDGFGPLQAPVGDPCADGLFDLLLRGHAHHLKKFAQRHVEGFFVHGQLLEKGMFDPILVGASGRRKGAIRQRGAVDGDGSAAIIRAACAAKMPLWRNW